VHIETYLCHMASVWEYLLNAGVTKDTDFNERVRLRGMNIGSLIGIALVFLGLLLGRDSVPFMWFMTAMMGILGASWLLNLLRFARLARYIILIATTLWIVSVSVAFGPAMGMEHYLYAMLVSILIFEVHDRWRLLNAFASVAALIALHTIHQLVPPVFPNPANTTIFFLANVTFNCTIIGLVCWLMMKDNKEYNTTILKRKEALLESNELKDKLFTIIAHDLRSPLNSLKAMLELLGSDLLNAEEQKMVVKDLETKLDASREVLDTLLVWSSKHYTGSAQPLTSDEKTLCLLRMFDLVHGFYAEELAAKNIRFSQEVPPDSAVLADYDKLQFVLRNLVGNAIKFVNDGGHISLQATPGLEWTTIIVKDDGVGIPATQIDTMFRLDKRVSTPGTHNEKGTGLGLIFCKEFIDGWNGNMWVESQAGKGAAFHFTVKAAKAA